MIQNRLATLLVLSVLALMLACGDDSNPFADQNPGETITDSGPRLTTPEATFDFGYAPQNSKVSHVFWLHSTGTDTLRILNVKPG